MDLNLLCIIVIIAIIIFILSSNCTDLFKTEKYTPIIKRPLLLTKTQNTCKFPCVNNSRDTINNKKSYIYQHGNRKILNASEYLTMTRRLLNDLSTKQIDISKLDNNNRKEIDYEGDRQYLTKFIDSKLNEVINSNEYLQHNGTWKYEHYHSLDPIIYYYEVNNENGELFDDLPSKFGLFKILYTLGNALRSSYTQCLAYITLINNKLNIEFTGIVNDVEKPTTDNLNVIPKEALKFTFIDSIANNDFDKFGYSAEKSGLNYIPEIDNSKIEVKADIPKEFKSNNFNAQHLPPLFGNGICKYPPYYKTTDGKSKYFNSPPLYS